MFFVKQKCVKVNVKTGEIEKQWAGCNEPKVYTVKGVFNDCMVVYNLNKVVFDLNGNVMVAPALNQSNWGESKLIPLDS